MSETIQWILVGIIIAIAVVLLVKSLFVKSDTGNNCGCGCSGCKLKDACEKPENKKDKHTIN